MYPTPVGYREFGELKSTGGRFLAELCLGVKPRVDFWGGFVPGDPPELPLSLLRCWAGMVPPGAPLGQLQLGFG